MLFKDIQDSFSKKDMQVPHLDDIKWDIRALVMVASRDPNVMSFMEQAYAAYVLAHDCEKEIRQANNSYSEVTMTMRYMHEEICILEKIREELETRLEQEVQNSKELQGELDYANNQQLTFEDKIASLEVDVTECEGTIKALEDEIYHTRYCSCEGSN